MIHDYTNDINNINDVNINNSVINQIIQIKKTKKISERYELQMYRIENELNKNKNEYNLLVNTKQKMEEEQKQLEHNDIRTMCEICCFKKDKFLSCCSCRKLLCNDCFDNILNNIDKNIINKIIKCPYCRHNNSLYTI
jgi:hypothetical protein